MYEKWSQIQLNLEKRLPSGQFKAWIATLIPVREGEALVLCAQTEFAAAHIRTWYAPLLAEVTQDVFGQKCRLRIECRPGLFQRTDPRACDKAVGSAEARALPDVDCAADAPGRALTPSREAFAKDEKKNSGSFRRGGFAELTEQKMHELLRGVSATNTFLARGEHATQRPSLPLPASSPFGLPSAAPALQSAATASVAEFLQSPAQVVTPAPALLKSVPSPRPLEQVQLGLPLELFDKRPENGAAECHWRYSFEDFVVGPSNELAYAASRTICNEAMHMDILFLSSAPGLGKTHLTHAVGKGLYGACNKQRPHVECLTAEEFASRFYLSLKGQDTERFKARYRTADLLLLEDVHFLQGKEKMQAELLATIKALKDRGSKIVFSSSFAPRDLKFIDEQLQSRFSSGLLTYIERPDEDTRRRILRTKASFHHILLPGEVEDVLARHIHADVRQIESCLHNLILKARLLNSGITLQMAWEVIGHYAAHSPLLDLDSIITHVCKGFGLTREQLFSSSRKQEYVSARNTAFFLARKHTDLSLEAIGRQFNRRHSTVLKGITNLEREMSRKSPQGLQIGSILSMIERNGNVFATRVN